MIEIALNLLPNYRRPTVRLYGMTALIDTGAVVPTFSIPLSVLGGMFETKLILDYAEIKGFGGVCTGKVCSVRNFRIGELTFGHLEVFVPSVAVTFHPFLLSASMFSGMKYSFDTVNSRFSLQIPDGNLKRSFFIKDLRGKLMAQVLECRS